MSDMHPRAPWKDVAFVGGYWNCEDRLRALLTYVRPWFQNIVAVVQQSDDDTLGVAKELADVVIEDPWLKHGNPSISKAVANAGSKWTFVISDDEWPTPELLNSFQDLVEKLKAEEKDGAWVHFVSSIDGFDFTKEQDAHLRFFRGDLVWPPTQHSRPMTENTIIWRPEGAFVRHDRSLDEMMIDYLNRYEVGLRGGAGEGQMAHNRQMMRNACIGVAEHKGWEYVSSFGWWSKVVEQAFEGKAPEGAPQPEIPKPVRRRRTRKTA